MDGVGGSLIAGKTEKEKQIWKQHISQARKKQWKEDKAYADHYKMMRNSEAFKEKYRNTRKLNEANMSDIDKIKRREIYRLAHSTAEVRKHHSDAIKLWYSKLSTEEKEKRRIKNRERQCRPEVIAKKKYTSILRNNITEIYDNKPFLTLKEVYNYKVKNENYNRTYRYFTSHYKQRTRWTNETFVVKDVEIAEMTTAEPGKGNVKYTGVKSLIIEYKGCKVNVGSGLSKEQRKDWYAHPEHIIGKTITVKYFEPTQDQSGSWSLRFPVLKAVYDSERDV